MSLQAHRGVGAYPEEWKIEPTRPPEKKNPLELPHRRVWYNAGVVELVDVGVVQAYRVRCPPPKKVHLLVQIGKRFGLCEGRGLKGSHDGLKLYFWWGGGLAPHRSKNLGYRPVSLTLTGYFRVKLPSLP